MVLTSKFNTVHIMLSKSRQKFVDFAWYTNNKLRILINSISR